VEMMARIVAQQAPEELPPEEEQPSEVGEVKYWLTPVRSEAEASAEQVIETLVKKEQIYAFGERTPGRKHLKPGDWLCFHASGKGVIAHAKVMSIPEKKPHPKVQHPNKYPWVFRVGEAKLYLNDPVVIDAEVRTKLDAFKNRDLNKPWGWFVQATRPISENDFNILTIKS
ncbi:MAG: EVE domain-containing protein, partial [Candidatus Bathyarchaeota archaeon]|nr:EVE domain-containing protein [Candidatus Bathyarchaeota archaeon]